MALVGMSGCRALPTTHPDKPLHAAEVQRQAAAAIWEGRDALIHSATGSGKTLAFLLPLLARLSYPPDTYPEDLKVRSDTEWLGSELLLWHQLPVTLLARSCWQLHGAHALSSCRNNPEESSDRSRGHLVHGWHSKKAYSRACRGRVLIAGLPDPAVMVCSH